MLRIIRTSTYAALLGGRDELDRIRNALDTITAARDRALTDVARARADAAKLTHRVASLGGELERAHEAAARAARRATAAETDRDTVRDQAGALDEVRADLLRLRDHAADDSGVRGAIAYGVLRDLITRARQERDEAGEDGGLPRPFDVIAMVLDFDNDNPDHAGEQALVAQEEGK